MGQITFDDFLDVKTLSNAELICCSLSQNFHWVRITKGHTPNEFKELIDFELNGYDYFYKNSEIKEQLISVFKGSVNIIPYN